MPRNPAVAAAKFGQTCVLLPQTTSLGESEGGFVMHPQGGFAGRACPLSSPIHLVVICSSDARLSLSIDQSSLSLGHTVRLGRPATPRY